MINIFFVSDIKAKVSQIILVVSVAHDYTLLKYYHY